ncbi:MAG: cysteine--tRNA ligase [Deltaproteobacteria bacterium]|nr:cysteine--tRNA ligase [Deltaproteobacteria bacterium]
MSLKLYNTLTRKVETFEPLGGNKVRIYVCGVTIYDRCHLGHARALVIFDLLYRFLKDKGYEVDFVRNFTDIDDKILSRAQEEKVSWKEVVQRNLHAFQEDFKDFGLLTPMVEPRATEHIADMIHLIELLMQKGVAYASDGEVFFSVKKFPAYGKLSGQTLEELRSGTRVEVNPKKKDPEDFVLWKASREGEPSWPSPWGPGRPGWHIECSAMSLKYLGSPFDIHGGGTDLIFPHHENEIAQSEGATGKLFSQFWIHNGMVTLQSEKMSKSTGNLTRVQEILKKYPAEVARFFLLTAHYRSPLEFSWELLEQAEKAVSRGYTALKSLREGLEEDQLPDKIQDLLPLQNIWQRFEGALDNDLNTPVAIAVFFEAVKAIHQAFANSKRISHSSHQPIFEEAQKGFRKIASILGAFEKDPNDYFQKSRLTQTSLTDSEIHAQIRLREEARSRKDWKQADIIRQKLYDEGIVLEDTPKGTIWKINF